MPLLCCLRLVIACELRLIKLEHPTSYQLPGVPAFYTGTCYPPNWLTLPNGPSMSSVDGFSNGTEVGFAQKRLVSIPFSSAPNLAAGRLSPNSNATLQIRYTMSPEPLETQGRSAVTPSLTTLLPVSRPQPTSTRANGPIYAVHSNFIDPSLPPNDYSEGRSNTGQSNVQEPDDVDGNNDPVRTSSENTAVSIFTMYTEEGNYPPIPEASDEEHSSSLNHYAQPLSRVSSPLAQHTSNNLGDGRTLSVSRPNSRKTSIDMSIGDDSIAALLLLDGNANRSRVSSPVPPINLSAPQSRIPSPIPNPPRRSGQISQGSSRPLTNSTLGSVKLGYLDSDEGAEAGRPPTPIDDSTVITDTAGSAPRIRDNASHVSADTSRPRSVSPTYPAPSSRPVSRLTTNSHSNPQGLNFNPATPTLQPPSRPISRSTTPASIPAALSAPTSRPTSYLSPPNALSDQLRPPPQLSPAQSREPIVRAHNRSTSAISAAPSVTQPRSHRGADEDADAEFVRSVYSRFEIAGGVPGDGYEEGMERTRARLPSVVLLQEAQDALENPLGASTATAASKRGDLSETEAAKLKNVDRYGFFVDKPSTRQESRLTVLPAAPLAKKVKRLKANASPPQASQRPTPPPEISPTPSQSRSSISSTASLYVKSPTKEVPRLAKWQKMLRAGKPDPGGNTEGWSLAKEVSKDTLRRRVWKGIPDRWRPAAWQMLMDDMYGRSKRKGLTSNTLVNEYRVCSCLLRITLGEF